MPNPTIDLLQVEISTLRREHNDLAEYCAGLEQNLNSQKTILLLKQKKIKSHEETIRLIEQAEAQE